MPVQIDVKGIEKNQTGVGSAALTVNVVLRTSGMDDMPLQIKVPVTHADQALRDATNQLLQFADDLKAALENSNGLQFR